MITFDPLTRPATRAAITLVLADLPLADADIRIEEFAEGCEFQMRVGNRVMIMLVSHEVCNSPEDLRHYVAGKIRQLREAEATRE